MLHGFNDHGQHIAYNIVEGRAQFFWQYTANSVGLMMDSSSKPASFLLFGKVVSKREQIRAQHGIVLKVVCLAYHGYVTEQQNNPCKFTNFQKLNINMYIRIYFAYFIRSLNNILIIYNIYNNILVKTFPLRYNFLYYYLLIKISNLMQ